MKTLVETSLFNLFASYTNGAGPAAGELPAAYNDFVNCLATLSSAGDLIELVAALMAAGAIGTAEGRDLKIVDVIRVFEEVFHLKINALYTKRGKVFDRCTDTTPFIDSLRKSYNRMLDARLA